MKKLVMVGVAIVSGAILGAVLAYVAIIWYVDRHPVLKTAVAAQYVSEQGLCSSGLDYVTSRPYWCEDSVLNVEPSIPYTVTSYGTVRLQLTASDASLQWGDLIDGSIINSNIIQGSI